MLIRIIAPLAAALTGTLVAAAPAGAVAPTTTTVHTVSRLTAPCPDGGSTYAQWEVTREITTYYDQDGTAVMQIIRAEGTGYTSNPATGYAIPNWFVRIFHHDLPDGQWFSTGPNVVTILPDGGASVPGAGRLVFAPLTGALVEHDGTDGDAERAELCAALGA